MTIDGNDPFIRAVAASLGDGLLAVCVNDELMGGDSCGLREGEVYELNGNGRGQRAFGVNSHGWQHSDHFAQITRVRCVNAKGEPGLEVGKSYAVRGGYFYGNRPCAATSWIVLKGLSPKREGSFALKQGGFALSRFSIEETAQFLPIGLGRSFGRGIESSVRAEEDPDCIY